MSGDVNFDDDLRIARLVMADGPKTDAEYALAQRVIAIASAAQLIEAQATRLEPWESMALTVATAQLDRGEEPTPNIAAVCIGALERIARGDAMTLAVQDALDWTARLPDPTPVVLAAVHNDPRASHVTARRVLRVAITECAARHQGRVHVAWFRHLLPEWIDPHAVGGAVAGWTAAGYLEAIPDQWEPNGGGSNAAKPTQVRRLVSPIPPIA